MVSTPHGLPDGATISPELTGFLVSRAPQRRIGMSLIDTDDLLNGTISDLAASCLSEPEKHQLAGYTFEKRRQHWLLGRLCAKRSVLKLIEMTGGPLRPTLRDITIAAAPDGRPFADLGPANLLLPVPDISISHSGKKVVALAAGGYCGIDIQLLTSTLFKVRDRFCSEQENNVLQAAVDDELTQLGMLWSAKEAVRKCFGSPGTIGFLAMALSRVDHGRSCSFLELRLDQRGAGVEAVTVAASVDSGYCLAACIVPKAGAHA